MPLEACPFSLRKSVRQTAVHCKGRTVWDGPAQRLPRPCPCVLCRDRACPELAEGAGTLTFATPLPRACRPFDFPFVSPCLRGSVVDSCFHMCGLSPLL